MLLVLSLVVGSFLGVVVDRLPRGMSLIRPRSRCAACATPLRPADMIPLIGFLLLRGRCRACGTAIPAALPLIELAAGVVMIWALAVVPVPVLAPTVLLGWSLLVLAFIDLRHLMLPDLVTLPLLVAGLVVAAVLPGMDWGMHLLGAVAGVAAFAAIRAAFFALRRVEGLGWGDVKLFGAAGAWLGVAGLPNTLLVAALSGLAYTLIRYRALEASRAIPFGAFLCLGIWLTWLYGPIALVR